MRILVTGGAGFIGSNLCRTLLARTDHPAEVVVIDDLSTGSLSNLDGLDVEIFQGSILDTDLIDRACTDADAIVHLAALGSVPRSVIDPVATHEANTTGTMAVLEAARRHGNLHTVVAGSSSVYGANPTLPKHEDLATRPLSPYGASKLATEGYALGWAASYSLPVLVFRFFNVFGPWQPAGHAYAAVIPNFVEAALDGRPVTIHGDGEQSRDFTFVDTVTSTIADAIGRTVTSDDPVNLAFGTRTNLLQVVEMLEEITGSPIAREHVERRAGDVRHSQAANDRLRALFPEIEPTPLAEGLRATVSWMRSTR